MSVEGPKFFKDYDFVQILTACKKVEEHKDYKRSGQVKQQVEALLVLVQESVMQNVVLIKYDQEVRAAYNTVRDVYTSKKNSPTEIQELFLDAIKEPITQFVEWLEGNIKRQNNIKKLSAITQLVSLAPLIAKVQKAIDAFPEKLSHIFIDIWEKEEERENGRIKALKPLEDKLIKLLDSPLKNGKTSRNAAYKQSKFDVQQNLYARHKEILLQKHKQQPEFDPVYTDFVGETGYFQDHEFKIVDHRWLRDLLVYAVFKDWQSANFAKAEELNLECKSCKNFNLLIPKVSVCLINFLRSLRNSQIEIADASDSGDGTVGGNRSLVAKFSGEGHKAVTAMQAKNWSLISDLSKKERVDGLYWCFTFLAHLHTAESLRLRIVQQINITADPKLVNCTDLNLFSPRPNEPGLTARLKQPSDSDGLIKTEVDQTELALIYSYKDAIEAATRALEIAKKNSTFTQTCQKFFDLEHVSSILEKNIKILSETLTSLNSELAS